MMNNFLSLLVIGKLFLASFIFFSIGSCGKEKTVQQETQSVTTSVEQMEEGENAEGEKEPIQAVVYSQRYDGTITY